MLSILCITACVNESRPPDGTMTEEEMVSFLIELHTVQSAVQNLRLPQDSAEMLFLALEKDLLYDHKVKDTVFYESYSWYLDHPEMMYEIYSAVVDSISLRESLVRGNVVQ